MAEASSLHGVLVIDKPQGPTSHDVVARCRKLLREKRIGHAGTLDPMATGVLVVLVGEGTKLAPYLTAADKSYVARVAFGIGTATLDAEGAVVARADLPPALLAELHALAADLGSAPDGLIAAALRAEAARTEQIPPVYSAISIDGERSHELARAGKEVEHLPRAVAVRSHRLIAAHVAPGEPPAIDLEITVSKGYYVRSLARDLGARLDVPAHLSRLRRSRSGAFDIASAVALDAGADALRAAIVPVAAAVGLALPTAQLTEPGTVRARHGKRLSDDDFAPGAAPPRDRASAWMDVSARLVAIGEHGDDGFSVLRGFGGA